MRPERANRRQTRTVAVGAVQIGGGAPVVVQSMTNTDTEDVPASVAQIEALWRAGSELVRLTVNTEKAADAVPRIRDGLRRRGCTVPLIGDFHFNGHRLLRQFPDCASALDKYRINPGNVGQGAKQDKQFGEMVEVAARCGKPVRIGVNWGSLDKALVDRLMDQNQALPQPQDSQAVIHEAMILSALNNAAKAEAWGLTASQIVLSCKMSGVQDLVSVYRELADRCDYALHLGLTEAGMGSKGIVASTAALAILLQQGIGDTIRVSLTPEPGQDRAEEVRVAQQILQTMGLRAFAPLVVACPGCGRTSSDGFQHLAQEVQRHIQRRMPAWRQQYPGVEALSVAVMGCVVNGPGESKQADIGISLPGNGERPAAPVYVDGAKVATLKGADIGATFIAMLDDYVRDRFAGKPQPIGGDGPSGT